MNYVKLEISKPSEDKEPQRRHKKQRPIHSQIQKSHTNSKLEAVVYTQRTYRVKQREEKKN